MFSSLPLMGVCGCGGDMKNHPVMDNHSATEMDTRNNVPNSILVEFRLENEKQEIDLKAYLIWLQVELFAGFYPVKEVEHAYLVLSKLRRVRKLK